MQNLETPSTSDSVIKQLHEIQVCEVCAATELESVLDLGLQPMCDDLVAIDSERQCTDYPVEILYCKNCGTAHQRYQIPKHLLFPRSYHYRSRFTADVLNGMEDLVRACEDKLGSLNDKLVVDIGCNDGSLLDAFRRRGSRTVGVEPTDACDDAAAKNHSTYKGFFDEVLAAKIVASHGHPDIITFTNVFAHIEDLASLLKSLRILISPTTLLVIENHYLGSILDKNQFDTFYHEHPRSYSFKSFQHIAKSISFEVAEAQFPSRYGGNIRVFLANPQGLPSAFKNTAAFDLASLEAREQKFRAQFIEMAKNLASWRVKMAAKINTLVVEKGPLVAKAFPGRAAILIKLLRLDTSHIGAVYEKPGSLKIGNYLPGTRIPIRSDNELPPLSQFGGPILNLAWHIPDEIRQYLTSLGYQGEVVDILGDQ